MKTYFAKDSFRTEGRTQVFCRHDDNSTPYPIRERQDLDNHSPTGFAWGYSGSGPAQLALAILADLFGDEIAVGYHQAFKFRVIAGLDQDKGWELTEDKITKVVADLRLEREGRANAV